MNDMATQTVATYTGADSETVDWAGEFVTRIGEAARRLREAPETVQVSRLLWDAAQASAAQDRAVIARQAEQIEALRADVQRLQQTVPPDHSPFPDFPTLPANALRYSR